MEQMKMHMLRVGEGGIMDRAILSDAMQIRLRDIGLIPGTPVVCVGRSPLGDPAAYRIRGAVFAMRKTDCARIILRR